MAWRALQPSQKEAVAVSSIGSCAAGLVIMIRLATLICE